ncbi:hypothetical protein ACFVGN_30565, partial [Streptomyces sp. NPDC057757]|uniref:hypothetical protein n=1 Tax=Streptomyces sp. NPDC057757 TaxID=3346241 RepID=UPI003682EBC4
MGQDDGEVPDSAEQMPARRDHVEIGVGVGAVPCPVLSCPVLSGSRRTDHHSGPARVESFQVGRVSGADLLADACSGIGAHGEHAKGLLRIVRSRTVRP